MNAPSPRSQQKQVDAFNAQYPIGTLVEFEEIRGGSNKSQHETRSEAWLIGGHTAAILLVGKSGCVALSHIKVLP